MAPAPRPAESHFRAALSALSESLEAAGALPFALAVPDFGREAARIASASLPDSMAEWESWTRRKRSLQSLSNSPLDDAKLAEAFRSRMGLSPAPSAPRTPGAAPPSAPARSAHAAAHPPPGLSDPQLQALLSLFNEEAPRRESAERANERHRDSLWREAMGRCLLLSSQIGALLWVFAPESPLADEAALPYLSAGFPVARFFDPRLASFGAGDYSLWDAGLVLGSERALRAAAASRAARRPDPETQFAPESPLLLALGLSPDLEGLSPSARSDRDCLGLAFESFLACRRGLSEDPEALFALALSLLGPERFPLAEDSLRPLTLAALNPVAWGDLSERAKALPDTLSESAQSFARACLSSAQSYPIDPAGDLCSRLRASELLASLASLPASLPEERLHRAEMALLAIRFGDAPACRALRGLGSSLRDPVGAGSASLRERLDRSALCGEAALELSDHPAGPWADLGGIDALARLALELSGADPSAAGPALETARLLLRAEPAPGACALLLERLLSARRSEALALVAESILLESAASNPSCPSARPRAL